MKRFTSSLSEHLIPAASVRWLRIGFILGLAANAREARLAKGRAYANPYHFSFEFDGPLIKTVRKCTDTAYPRGRLS